MYKGWTHLFGQSEWSYELPAALFGIGGILAIASLARRLFDRSTGLLAALLLSVSVAHVHVSQQVRAYSLCVLLAVWAVHSLCVLLDHRSRGSVAALVATCLALLYSHYAAAFVVFSIFLFAFLHAWARQRSALRPLAIAAALVSFGYLPGLYTLYLHYTEFVPYAWMPPPSFAEGVAVIMMFNSNSWAYFACAVAVAAAAGISRRSRLFSGNRHILFHWWLVPIALVLVLSLVGKPFFSARYFVFLLPAYVLILAHCIAALARPLVRAAAICVFLLVSIMPLSDYFAKYLTTRGREVAARFVAERFQAGDIILHTSFFEFLPTWLYYHQKRYPEYIMAQARGDPFDQFWPEKDIVQDKAVFERHDRIWVFGRGRPGEQLNGILNGQRFRNHRVEGVFRSYRATVFLLQRRGVGGGLENNTSRLIGTPHFGAGIKSQESSLKPNVKTHRSLRASVLSLQGIHEASERGNRPPASMLNPLRSQFALW